MCAQERAQSASAMLVHSMCTMLPYLSPSSVPSGARGAVKNSLAKQASFYLILVPGKDPFFFFLLFFFLKFCIFCLVGLSR